LPLEFLDPLQYTFDGSQCGVDRNPVFIREIRFRNYSIYRDSKIRLSPLTVLIGPNRGGKSAIFEALLNFSMISRGNLRQAFNRYLADETLALVASANLSEWRSA
jgi:recombinational DNA repair ATPase RecF